jgi:hypothetical protein
MRPMRRSSPGPPIWLGEVVNNLLDNARLRW